MFKNPFYVYGCFACIYVCESFACNASGPPGTVISDGYKSCMHREWNPAPLTATSAINY